MLQSTGTDYLEGYFFFKKSVHVGIQVNSKDYGLSHTCYPYTSILIHQPPKIQPYPTSCIVELRNCLIKTFSERSSLVSWCSFPREYI